RAAGEPSTTRTGRSSTPRASASRFAWPMTPRGSSRTNAISTWAGSRGPAHRNAGTPNASVRTPFHSVTAAQTAAPKRGSGAPVTATASGKRARGWPTGRARAAGTSEARAGGPSSRARSRRASGSAARRRMGRCYRLIRRGASAGGARRSVHRLDHPGAARALPQPDDERGLVPDLPAVLRDEDVEAAAAGLGFVAPELDAHVPEVDGLALHLLERGPDLAQVVAAH